MPSPDSPIVPASPSTAGIRVTSKSPLRVVSRRLDPGKAELLDAFDLLLAKAAELGLPGVVRITRPADTHPTPDPHVSKKRLAAGIVPQSVLDFRLRQAERLVQENFAFDDSEVPSVGERFRFNGFKAHFAPVPSRRSKEGVPTGVLVYPQREVDGYVVQHKTDLDVTGAEISLLSDGYAPSWKASLFVGHNLYSLRALDKQPQGRFEADRPRSRVQERLGWVLGHTQ